MFTWLQQGYNGSTEVNSYISCGQGVKEQRGTLTASFDCTGSEPSSDPSEPESLLLPFGNNLIMNN